MIITHGHIIKHSDRLILPLQWTHAALLGLISLTYRARGDREEAKSIVRYSRSSEVRRMQETKFECCLMLHYIQR
jgi:hypothetical protein